MVLYNYFLKQVPCFVDIVNMIFLFSLISISWYRIKVVQHNIWIFSFEKLKKQKKVVNLPLHSNLRYFSTFLRIFASPEQKLRWSQSPSQYNKSQSQIISIITSHISSLCWDWTLPPPLPPRQIQFVVDPLSSWLSLTRKDRSVIPAL